MDTVCCLSEEDVVWLPDTGLGSAQGRELDRERKVKLLQPAGAH